MTNYQLGDLVDIGMLQRLADSNYKASGMPMTIVDAIDLSVLVKAGWPEICEVFHRAHSSSEQRCRMSDNYVTEHLNDGEVLQYKCQNGLWHVALPILVSRKHLATLFLTQFFYKGELPDVDYFSRQADEFGYDVDRYLEAVRALPVFTREKVDYILAYDKALVGFIADLADHAIQAAETTKSLIESEEKYRSLVNNVNIGIFRLSVTGRFIQANPAMARIFGYTSIKDFLDTDPSAIYQSPSDMNECIQDLRQNSMVKDREWAMKTKDGDVIWCAVTITAHRDEMGKAQWLDGVVEDISKQKEAKEQLQKAHDELDTKVKARTFDLEKMNELLLAEIAERKRFEKKFKELSETDPLTSIFNRRKLFEFLEREINMTNRYRRPLSLLILDLDHFKRINDTFGHGIGDMILKKTAGIVSRTIRKTDIFARYGGEEFVVILTETDIDGAAFFAEKIRSTIAVHRFSKVGRITISAGVAQYRGKEKVEDFMKRADTALYSAKQAGRNRVATAAS